ncbi:glucokinase [Halogranum amylolyticum]|uniref:Glucokinase n=1 Tax=Halogranum amylolyticum TaxID=660520 RepID=A0A1H8UPR4_9EURY|nr:ROK family protein [Halogranum amylolyticum]SEP05141.1 glucokinase [Halogranum amylolyticum]
MTSGPTIAVVDVGSTSLRYGVATSEGPCDVRTEATRPRELTDQLVDVAARLQSEGNDIRHVSVSTTGLVDAERGVIAEFDTATGETLHDVPVTSTIERELGLPATVANDCTVAALGEAVFGAGQPHETVVHVTFGTGIGAGVIVDGQPLRGERGYAAEVGLIPIVADGALSSTGVRGAWEAYCSGRGIPQFVRRLLDSDDRESTLRAKRPLTAPDVFAAANDGDPVAQSCLDSVAQYNAAGIGAVVNTYDPGIVTLGGSVALENSEWIVDGIDERLDDYVLAAPPDVRLTPLGTDIELYGAAAAFFGDER